MNESNYQFRGTDGYIISDDLMLTANIAIKMNKPLLVKGRTGHRQDGTGRIHRQGPRKEADHLEHQVHYESAGWTVSVRCGSAAL